METLLFIIALITAGVALTTGLNSVFVGFNKVGDKVNLIFGIHCLILFTFLVFPPTGFIINDQPPYPVTLDIKRIFIWLYYGSFPIFLEYYSGYKNKPLKLIIYFTTIASYPVYLSTASDDINPVWRLLVLVPLGLVGLYGLLSARHQIKNGNIEEGRWLKFAMYVYLLFYLMAAAFNIGGAQMEKLLGIRQFFSFHFNPLAFILIMSMRLRKNTLDKYKLEKVLRMQNQRWERLMHNIQLLVIEVDMEGTIKYVNPFGIKFLGGLTGDDIIGLNWFQTFLKPEDQHRLRTKFMNSLQANAEPDEVKTPMVSLDGVEHNINWTSVLMRDGNGMAGGLMSIGVDTTQLDRAFKQVEDLKNELAKENIYLKEVILDDMQTEIIGRSEAIIYAIQKAGQVANTHATVLLEGETGVGKELFANLVHKMSGRSEQPLIKVNCAALPDELIESELFGHEKGSFTGALQARKGRFELAHGGTIFLDEISEMPISLQPKLLRVLQNGEFERIGGQQTIKVDVRVISATNRDLLGEVRQGRFREDLYYRLNVYPITIPSLRARKSDIPLLVDHFIKKFALEFKKEIRNISKADIGRLEEYDWPGNVRELINLIERSVISSSGDTLKIVWEKNHNGDHSQNKSGSTIRELEREHILKVLHESNWKINGEQGAAEKLGLNPNTLRSRMKKLNIFREEI
ncbi:MAG TPA: sigma 54-interacting transcriptional regulator [Chitinophagaceae bacterium]|nr:sigma 54-interacting transcriptional regulator [Chitinophagaceae bacterium]